MNNILIEKLSKGEISLRFEKGVDLVSDLREVLSEAFINCFDIPYGTAEYYKRDDDDYSYWMAFNNIGDMIWVPLKDFFSEKCPFKRGDEILVADTEDGGFTIDYKDDNGELSVYFKERFIIRSLTGDEYLQTNKKKDELVISNIASTQEGSLITKAKEDILKKYEHRLKQQQSLYTQRIQPDYTEIKLRSQMALDILGF